MHTYVINLDRSMQRRRHMTSELSRTGLDYEFARAIDGRSLRLDDEASISQEFLAKNDFPAGAAGCAMSHLKVYRKIITDGADHALVLEDDVATQPDLAVIAEAVVPYLTGAEVALFNYAHPEGCRMARKLSVCLPNGRRLALPLDSAGLVNAAAYVITREACVRMTQRLLPLHANADEWSFFYEEGVLDRIRCVVPMVVTKDAQFDSTIGQYSLGTGAKASLFSPLVRRRVPLLHDAIVYRRSRIMRQWERSALVDSEFVVKPSRLD